MAAALLRLRLLHSAAMGILKHLSRFSFNISGGIPVLSFPKLPAVPLSFLLPSLQPFSPVSFPVLQLQPWQFSFLPECQTIVKIDLCFYEQIM